MSRPLHILYATEIDLRTSGGNITHVRQVVAELEALNCRVTLVCPKVRTSHPMPGRLVMIPGLPFRFLWFMTYEALLFFYGFFSHRKNRYDLVYVRSELYTLGAAAFAKIKGLPFVVEFNGDKPREMRLRDKSERAIGLVRWIESMLCRWADVIVVSAPQLVDKLARQNDQTGDKIRYVPNGADARLFKPESPSRLREKTDYPARTDQTVVGFIGRLLAWQGLPQLIDAADLLKERTDIHFIVVGEGPLYADLAQQIRRHELEDHITLVGHVPHKTIPQWINSFDLCVIPRGPDIIGMPVKLFEYMACAKPVIASRLPGFDILESEDAGILVEPANPKALMEAILQLAAEPTRRARFGANGRALFLQRFTWQATARQLHDLFLKCCEQQ